MSCKVFEPDSPTGAGPVPWKQLNAGAAESVQGAAARRTPPRASNSFGGSSSRRRGMRRPPDSGRARPPAAIARRRNFNRSWRSSRRPSASSGKCAPACAARRRPTRSKLALAIARRVLRRELAVDPDALESLLLGALEKLRGQEISRVRVHPSHADADRRLPSEGVPRRGDRGDPGSGGEPPGTAIFETERGNLDASIESQLQEIERGLADRLRNQP